MTARARSLSTRPRTSFRLITHSVPSTAFIEKKLQLKTECSVIVCRGFDGESATFPVFENHHKNGILAETVLPARISEDAEAEARPYAIRIANGLKYIGVLCIEFFILEDGSVVANETAPRPHNSGHATIEACMTSQFEQQVRTMAGLPPRQHHAAFPGRNAEYSRRCLGNG